MPHQPSKASDLANALRRLIPHSLSQHHVPGLNIAVAWQGQIILDEGFGFADLNTQAPMTSRHVTHAGSMSKTYTATAVMQLVEAGVLDLNEPANRYLPDFQIHNPLGEREITLLDLLTHRSGINGGVDVDCDFALTGTLAERLPQRYQTPWLKAYGGKLLPLWSAKVGERFQYSNQGTATLGYIVEKNNPEGLDFPTYIYRYIMSPLGMAYSLQPVTQDPASLPVTIQANLSSGYAGFRDRLIPTPRLYVGDYPAGSLLTTPGDHIRLLLAYLNGGEWNGARILRPESVEIMLAPRVDLPTGHKIGLIWWHHPVEGLDFFGHTGEYMFGWSNLSLACPQHDLALVVCTNKWNMLGERNSAGMDIARFIAAWLKRESAGKRRPSTERSWAWQVSYVRGLVLVDQVFGVLAIPSPLTDTMLAEMAQGACSHPAHPDAEDWDEAGFRAGVQDLAQIEKTPQAIQAFLESDGCAVPYEELIFIYRQLDPSGARPLVPMMPA